MFASITNSRKSSEQKNRYLPKVAQRWTPSLAQSLEKDARFSKHFASKSKMQGKISKASGFHSKKASLDKESYFKANIFRSAENKYFVPRAHFPRETPNQQQGFWQALFGIQEKKLEKRGDEKAPNGDYFVGEPSPKRYQYESGNGELFQNVKNHQRVVNFAKKSKESVEARTVLSKKEKGAEKDREKKFSLRDTGTRPWEWKDVKKSALLFSVFLLATFLVVLFTFISLAFREKSRNELQISALERSVQRLELNNLILGSLREEQILQSKIAESVKEGLALPGDEIVQFSLPEVVQAKESSFLKKMLNLPMLSTLSLGLFFALLMLVLWLRQRFVRSNVAPLRQYSPSETYP